MNVKKQTEKRMTERITNKWIEVEQIKENKGLNGKRNKKEKENEQMKDLKNEQK